MLKAVIIEDDERFRNTLKIMLDKHARYELAGEAESVEDAVQLLNKTDADILFLDVELTDGTAFDLIKTIDTSNFKIVFTTGHSEYAVLAFRYSAIDYLLKPLDENEFKNALQKVESAKYSEELQIQLKALKENKAGFKKVAVPSQSGMELINIDSIMYCQSESNYTHFFLENGKSMLSAKVLKEYEELFEPHGFIRVHKSNLINPKFIKKYMSGDGGRLLMKDNAEISVSRRRKKVLLEKIKNNV